jgi:hypothetical protein
MQDSKEVMLLLLEEEEEEGQETKVKSGAFENPCNSNLATPVTRRVQSSPSDYRFEPAHQASRNYLSIRHVVSVEMDSV